MSEPAIRRPSANRRWPMTTEAWRTLVDEVSRMRADVAALAGEMRDDGVLHLPLARAPRRLEVLSGVLDAAERVDDADRAVIGRRATLLEEDGEWVSYALVLPGDGDPAQGWISADSPLGAAVLGAAPGEVVEIVAPAGRRTVTVLAVELPAVSCGHDRHRRGRPAAGLCRTGPRRGRGHRRRSRGAICQSRS